MEVKCLMKWYRPPNKLTLQVVRWVRRFPLHCVADREYIIARRAFRGEEGAPQGGHHDNSMYGITKGLQVNYGQRI